MDMQDPLWQTLNTIIGLIGGVATVVTFFSSQKPLADKLKHAAIVFVISFVIFVLINIGISFYRSTISTTTQNSPQATMEAFCQAMEEGNVSLATVQFSQQLQDENVPEASLAGKRYSTCATDPDSLTSSLHGGKVVWTSTARRSYHRSFDLERDSSGIWKISSWGIAIG